MKDVEELLYEVKEDYFEDHSENCRECPHYTVIPDMYGTGDSPTGYECEGEIAECPGVIAFVADFICEINDIMKG